MLFLVSLALAADLDDLAVRDRAPHDGYSREAFGRRWADVDHNGCNTRDDILARDLEGERIRPAGCVVLSGELADPYTGRAIHFVRGSRTSDDVQIDHVVSLSNAWVTGAAAWPAAKRLALANDPLNLLAVDGPTNASKGDDDASEWLPPNTAVWCWYARTQVEVKARYGLWVTPGERAALARVLATCPA